MAGKGFWGGLSGRFRSTPNHPTVNRSWRDVPMPECIANLPRSDGGLPVPHIVKWTSEEIPRAVRDPALRPLGCNFPALGHEGKQGVGQPIFGAMAEPRQRASALGNRCHVCDSELGDTRWLAQTPEWTPRGYYVEIDGKKCPMVIEPWLCEPCLVYVLQVCPVLRQGRANVSLLRVREAVPLLMSEPSIYVTGTGGDEPVATYVALAVTDGDEVSADDFLAARTDGQ